MPLAIRTITRFQDADDVNVTPGSGVDKYSCVYDDATGKFVLGQRPRLDQANTFTVGPQTIQTGGLANKGVIVKAAAGQTANLLEYQSSAGAQLAAIEHDGRVCFGVGVAWDLIGALPIGVQHTTESTTGAFLGLVNNASSGNGPFFFCVRSRGTNSAPTAVQSGDVLGVYAASGQASTTGSGTGVGTGGGRIAFTAAGNWSGSSQPADLMFSTTASSSATAINRLNVPGSGGLQVLTAAGAIAFGIDVNGVLRTNQITGTAAGAAASKWLPISDGTTTYKIALLNNT